MAASSPSCASLVHPPRAPAARWRVDPTPGSSFSLATSAPCALAIPEASASGQPAVATATARSRGSRVTTIPQLPARSLGAPLRSTPWVMTPPPTPVPRLPEDLVVDVFAGSRSGTHPRLRRWRRSRP